LVILRSVSTNIAIPPKSHVAPPSLRYLSKYDVINIPTALSNATPVKFNTVCASVEFIFIFSRVNINVAAVRIFVSNCPRFNIHLKSPSSSRAHAVFIKSSFKLPFGIHPRSNPAIYSCIL
jgi:hypothetical protein